MTGNCVIEQAMSAWNERTRGIPRVQQGPVKKGSVPGTWKDLLRIGNAGKAAMLPTIVHEETSMGLTIEEHGSSRRVFLKG